MERQKLLFSIENLLDINPMKNFEVLFSFLDTSFLEKTQFYSTGRYPVSSSNILRALIYKNLRSIYSLTDLVLDLSNNPSAASKCGFDILKIFPSLERFSSFLKDTPNETLQRIRVNLILKLIELGIISGRYLCIDSYHIFAKLKENNLKTSVKDRFDKHKVLKGDPEAKLGVYIHYPNPSKKEAKFFWGYRNHVITDGLTELPIWEVTKPASVHETKLFIPMVSETQKAFSFDIKGVIGDSGYDAAEILKFITNELRSKPYIPKNPRNTVQPEKEISSNGMRICIAGFKMSDKGLTYEKKQNRLRRKFICPIRYSKRFAKQHPVCPIWHPKFLAGKGCYAYLRVDEDIRKSIDYDSEHFKKTYNLRSGCERTFSRLIEMNVQHPSVKGLRATANLCTIAHITILLTALTAVKSGCKEQIRSSKSFISSL